MGMTKIKVNYIWCWAQYIFLAFLCVLMLLLPILLNWYSSTELWLKIVWNVVFSFSILFCVIFALFYFQTATICSHNIAIKSMFGLIKIIDWQDVYDIRIEDIITGTAGIKTISKEWIVIQTDKNQWDPYIKPNRKKKGPWYIAATRENINVIKEYMSKCRPDILPIEPEG